MTRWRECVGAAADWLGAPIADALARAGEVREDLYRWRGGFVPVMLWRSWASPGRPWWRRAWWALREWPTTVVCPSCDGQGGDMSVGGCEWCGGCGTWDLRDLNDEAWAMLDAAKGTRRASRFR